ncbi:MAG TPA: RNA methyltransferase [Polyangiaceae bacterium]|nr:RNA methyltransferase [Polyangiaceae bacterium]
MNSVAIALVHHPILDRQGAVITTAITNLDLHDMARSACSYGISALYVVHPVAAQRELALRVKAHWVSGSGARRIPTREAAMTLVQVVPAIDDVYAALGGRSNVDLYVTSARGEGRRVTTYAEARRRMSACARTSLVMFGTGWGLTPAVIDASDVFLAPLDGAGTGYNHLSVRAACAIVLDRLLGTRDG